MNTMNEAQQSSPTNLAHAERALTHIRFTQTAMDIATAVKSINQLSENLSHSYLSKNAPEYHADLCWILADTARRIAGLMNELGENMGTEPIKSAAAMSPNSATWVDDE